MKEEADLKDVTKELKNSNMFGQIRFVSGWRSF